MRRASRRTWFTCLGGLTRRIGPRRTASGRAYPPAPAPISRAMLTNALSAGERDLRACAWSACPLSAGSFGDGALERAVRSRDALVDVRQGRGYLIHRLDSERHGVADELELEQHAGGPGRMLEWEPPLVGRCPVQLNIDSSQGSIHAVLARGPPTLAIGGDVIRDVYQSAATRAGSVVMEGTIGRRSRVSTAV